MAITGRAEDIALVEAFIAQDKELSGPPPEFGPKASGKKHGTIWDATWPIANSSGIIESSALRVNYAPASSKPFSIVLVFRGQCVTRLDFVDDAICHANPLWAQPYGVPPNVCGPHIHRWDHNHRHIIHQQVWELPCREPLPPQIRRFDQAFPWFADQINLKLSPGDRDFDLPAELI